MHVVLMVASGASWEPAALTLLDRHPGIVVLKRCVDVDDLLASASAGQADAAVIGVNAPGLDTRAIDQLRHHGVRPVVIVPPGPGEDAARLRAGRIGIGTVVLADDLEALPRAITDSAEGQTRPAEGRRIDEEAIRPPAEPPPPSANGRVFAVWGAAGAPGRTTVAAAIAAELSRRKQAALLVDVDPYGGSVAQQLGILDEVSGLLQAARFSAAGQLDSRLASAIRMLGPGLGVITGLPRADRWTELRTGLVEDLAAAGRRGGHVVLDTGFSVEEDTSSELTGRPGRNQMTLDALQFADELIVVGTADPVGLTRLARGLVELRERGTLTPIRVVINRMRSSLRWSERDIAGMIAQMATPVGLHFLPDDRATVDKALVAGRTLVETAPDAPLPKAVAALVDAMVPVPASQLATR